MITKRCSTCAEIKPISDFNKQSAGKYGIRSFCRKCQAKKSKIYRFERKELKTDTNKFISRVSTYKSRIKRREQVDKMRSATSKQLDLLLERYADDINKTIKNIVSSYETELKRYAEEIIKERRSQAYIHIAELRDNYVKNLLSGNDEIPKDMIPESLIKLKREEIRIKRLIKEMTQ